LRNRWCVHRPSYASMELHQVIFIFMHTHTHTHIHTHTTHTHITYAHTYTYTHTHTHTHTQTHTHTHTHTRTRSGGGSRSEVGNAERMGFDDFEGVEGNTALIRAASSGDAVLGLQYIYSYTHIYLYLDAV
jgi:hypothetical protein